MGRTVEKDVVPHICQVCNRIVLHSLLNGVFILTYTCDCRTRFHSFIECMVELSASYIVQWCFYTIIYLMNAGQGSTHSLSVWWNNVHHILFNGVFIPSYTWWMQDKVPLIHWVYCGIKCIIWYLYSTTYLMIARLCSTHSLSVL